MSKNIFTRRSDAICRSLLQKAVRRGDAEVTKLAAISLIDDNDIPWLRNRLGVIAVEECWKEISTVEFSLSSPSLIKNLTRLAHCPKHKDAAGLGSLAYELSLGDTSTLDFAKDKKRDLKIISEAIQRPMDFWPWIKSMARSDFQKRSVNQSEIAFKFAGWPWDKAFAIASSYLSHNNDINPDSPGPKLIATPFSYWTAIDKHTPLGKQALSLCAEKLKVDPTKLGWIQFYLESAKCKNLTYSFWWELEKKWRFKKYGINEEEAINIWNDACYFLSHAVADAENSLIQKLKKAELKHNLEIKDQNSLFGD